MITTSATTPATPAGSTPATAESTAAEPPPQAGEDLGPLAEVPVMDQSQDYIGEVDYDQHLMPALLPIRPGTKADGVQANVEGSGAGAGAGTGAGDGDVVKVGDGDDLLELAQDPVEGSGMADDVGETAGGPQTQHQKTNIEDVKQIVETEQSKSEAQKKKPAQVSGGAVQPHPGGEGAEGTQGSLSAVSGQPACGVMGSSLATLLARNRFVSPSARASNLK